MSSSICPYCFDSMNRLQSGSWLLVTRTATFRCLNTDAAKCALEPDLKLAAYRGLPPVLEQRVFSVPVPFHKRMPTQGICTCRYESAKRICPECHNTLPSQFDSLENITFGLIGAKFSGKSNFIGVLIDRLVREVGRGLGGSLNALDGDTTTRYGEMYKRFLFEDEEAVPTSRSVQTDIRNRYPLSYSFTLRRRHKFQRARAIGLSLFDTAGEDLRKDDFITTHVRYIGNARGLIFLLDPLQLPGLQSLLPKASRVNFHLTDPSDVIDTIIRILRTKHHVRPPGKIKIPIAVVFSKIDMVRPHVSPDSPINRPSAHNGLYDEVDGQAVHESIRSYLVDWGAQSIDNTMDTHFSNYRYFGISSLGSAPDASNRLTRGISPFRVEDPFLWLLAQVGFIGKAKSEKKP